jgi:hypothetical protein
MVLSFEVALSIAVAGAAVAFATLSALAGAIDCHARISGLKLELRRLRAKRSRPD